MEGRPGAKVVASSYETLDATSRRLFLTANLPNSTADTLPAIQRTGSFFSSSDYIDVVSRVTDFRYVPLAIPVTGSGPPRTMYAVRTAGAPYLSRFILLAPRNHCASPGWEGRLESSTLEEIMRELRRRRIRGFRWNVRYDHEPLAVGLTSLGLRHQRSSTQVLALVGGYDSVFAGYNATIRNQVRKARKRGVVVRDVQEFKDVSSYHEMYLRLDAQKGGMGFRYPLEFFLNLWRIERKVRFLVAEFEGRIVAGGIFFRDGYAVTYWHGASDRAYSHVFPLCLVIDEVVRWGSEIGAASLNLGPSEGIASLEKFKSFWGAGPALNWSFEWTNPLRQNLSRVKRTVSMGMHVLRGI